MTTISRTMRRLLVAISVLLPVTFVVQGTSPQPAQAAYAYTFGTEPYADTLAAAAGSARCGLSQMQLAALMIAPSFPETGASGNSAPSPQTMSRYDNQEALYSFSSWSTAYRDAFWHPGIGVWAIDSAGGWDLTAAEAANTNTAAVPVAEEIARRWCSYTGDPGDEAARRAAAWKPWHGCGAGRCETIYNAIFDPNGLKLNLDASVTRGGGMQTRTCRIPGGSTVTCHLVDLSRTQGYKGFAIPAFGPSPVSKPFYVLRVGNTEQRWWLKEDSGYNATVSATKPVKANARTMSPTPSITWAAADGLCDLTAQKGACGVVASSSPLDAEFHEMAPQRIVDSRAESRVGQFSTPWSPGESRNVQFAGVAGIPSNASAVVVNLTAVNPSAATHLTMWPTGQAIPATSNLNVPKGDTRANLVTVGLGSNGMASIRSNSAVVNVVVDLVGWYGTTSSVGTRYNPVTPTRVLDTRSGPGQIGRFAPAETRNLSVVGVGGVPAGARAVVLNVTGVGPTRPTHLTVWPAGTAKPLSSNLNVPAGDVRANQVIAKVGQDGLISLYNNAGATDLVVDVVGWFGATGQRFTPVAPARLWDSRGGPGAVGSLGPAGVREVVVVGAGNVPAEAKSVVVNITVVNPTAATYLTAWSTGSNKPATSNLNVPAGDVRANLAMATVGSGGKVSFYNNAGDAHVVVDVVGWFR